MLDTYRIRFWNAFFFLSLLLVFAFIVPHILQEATHEEETQTAGTIRQKETTSTFWKRGKYSSTTTVKENNSSSNLSPKPSHSSSGWMNIKWKKDDNTGS